jgi:hypothetical protein
LRPIDIQFNQRIGEPEIPDHIDLQHAQPFVLVMHAVGFAIEGDALLVSYGCEKRFKLIGRSVRQC